jgi:Zn-dependent protease/CBS domain-containing protein
MHAFRIGKIFGVELRVDWSWVFIFVLLTWNLISVFSRWHPEWPAFEALMVAGAASLAFFAGILLHELAHSVVAMSYGLKVRSITLFLFGGVSNIEREPPSAKAEFFTAIVGPVTSIGLGVGFLAVASVVTSLPMPDAAGGWSSFGHLGPLATLLVWLGPINIMIGLFNCIPGFPLDGGRVLRSALWAITGDLRLATRAASATGQAVGGLFIIAGIAMSFGARLPFFGTGFISGLWLAFIGWFLHGAASQATTRLAIDDALAGMTVEQLMQRHGPITSPSASVATFVHEHLIPGDDRALPVLRDGALLGLVSISDVRALRPDQWADTPVGAVMRAVETLAIATPQEPVATAFEQLVRQNIDQLPVVANHQLVGMLRRRDVTRWLELAWKPATGAPEKGVSGTASREGGSPLTGEPAHHAT